MIVVVVATAPIAGVVVVIVAVVVISAVPTVIAIVVATVFTALIVVHHDRFLAPRRVGLDAFVVIAMMIVIVIVMASADQSRADYQRRERHSELQLWFHKSPAASLGGRFETTQLSIFIELAISQGIFAASRSIL